jgi:hypothetical protein
MLDTIENPAGAELELGQQQSKRARIEAELRTNSQRSYREIARVLGDGICHKTVGTARVRLGIASPLANSPTVSPVNSPDADISLAGATDKAMAMIANLTKPAPPVVPEWDPFDDAEALVVPPQPAIAVYQNQMGTITIRQPSDEYGEDDELIVVRVEHAEKLIASIRRAAAALRE